jgi:hypothetical protein
MTICPKCQYQRREHDAAVHPGVCPSCGIAYLKWQEAQAARELASNDTADEPGVVEPAAPLWRRARDYVCFVPGNSSSEAFWFRIALYAVFVVWGARFMLHGNDSLWIGRSFLHNINLPFHEFGHVLFGVFGTFWMILGGSLFQILLPLFPLVYFSVWQRDNFSAALMLWWSGQNFIDVSPYIADAQLRALPLISGSDESHDWGNLLTMTGTLEFTDYFADLCFTLGVCVMLLAYCWGGCLLLREHRARNQSP